METTRENYDALLEEVMREIPPKPEQRQPMAQGDVGSSAESPAGGIVCPGRPGCRPGAVRSCRPRQSSKPRPGWRGKRCEYADPHGEIPEGGPRPHLRGMEANGPLHSAWRASLSLLARGREYVREDGATGVFMRIRKVFDVRQTTGRAIKQRPIHGEYNRIKALLTDTPVPVCLSEEVPATVGAVYLPEQGVVNVARGLEGKALFFSAARELARESGCQSTFLCDCVANILCSRYRMEPRYPDRIPETYANLEPKAKRAVLADIRQVAWLIERRMDRNLDRLVNLREKQRIPRSVRREAMETKHIIEVDESQRQADHRRTE